jgi:hypothetical protein
MTNNLMLAISNEIAKIQDSRKNLKQTELKLNRDKKDLLEEIEICEMRFKNIIAFDKELKNQEQREVKAFNMIKADQQYIEAKKKLKTNSIDLDKNEVSQKENLIILEAKQREYDIHRLATLETIADKGLRV